MIRLSASNETLGPRSANLGLGMPDIKLFQYACMDVTADSQDGAQPTIAADQPPAAGARGALKHGVALPRRRRQRSHPRAGRDPRVHISNGIRAGSRAQTATGGTNARFLSGPDCHSWPSWTAAASAAAARDSTSGAVASRTLCAPTCSCCIATRARSCGLLKAMAQRIQCVAAVANVRQTSHRCEYRAFQWAIPSERHPNRGGAPAKSNVHHVAPRPGRPTSTHR